MTKSTKIQGPVQGGKYGWPFAASMLDMDTLDYSEHEYFLQGEATRFRMKDGAEQDRSGFWQAESAGVADFKTRLYCVRASQSSKLQRHGGAHMGTT